MNNNVLIKPLVTEKSMQGVDTGKYTFAVVKSANKTTIKNAIVAKFKVHVVSISTSLLKSKTRRVGMKRQEVTESGWKKAIVTVKKGEKIALFEPAGEEKKKK